MDESKYKLVSDYCAETLDIPSFDSMILGEIERLARENNDASRTSFEYLGHKIEITVERIREPKVNTEKEDLWK